MAEHIPVVSPRIIRAINVAAFAHRNDVRKGTDIPYVSHVFGVMHFVSPVSYTHLTLPTILLV